MKILKHGVLELIVLTILILGASSCWATYLQDDEINEIYDDVWLVGYDLSTQFPAIGTFDNGLGDATKSWTVNNSGGGSVIEYPTQGWVGLRCSAGQSVSIEYGPIIVSKTPNGTTKPSFDWDQIGGAIHFRGNPAYPYQSMVAGKLQLDFYDAAGRECHPMIAIDMSSSAVNGYCPAVGLDSTGNASNYSWAAFAFQFTLPHSSWYKISKVKISYSVPPGALVPTTEVQLDQIYLVPWWQKPY
jgi:hypothetical protein